MNLKTIGLSLAVVAGTSLHPGIRGRWRATPRRKPIASRRAARCRRASPNTATNGGTPLVLARKAEFCQFTSAKDGSQINVLLSTLTTKMPTLAALAYYAQVQLGSCNGNPGSCYCSLLGGSDLFGGINAAGGGWVLSTDPNDVLEACIFPDRSSIDSWGLAYHSADIIRGKNLAHVLKYADPIHRGRPRQDEAALLTFQELQDRQRLIADEMAGIGDEPDVSRFHIALEAPPGLARVEQHVPAAEDDEQRHGEALQGRVAEGGKRIAARPEAREGQRDELAHLPHRGSEESDDARPRMRSRIFRLPQDPKNISGRNSIQAFFCRPTPPGHSSAMRSTRSGLRVA